MLKIASVIAASLFIAGAAPIGSYNDCHDGCILNCVKMGGTVLQCSIDCQDQVCIASRAS